MLEILGRERKMGSPPPRPPNMASPQGLLSKGEGMAFYFGFVFSDVWVFLSCGPLACKNPLSFTFTPACSCHAQGDPGHMVQVTRKSGLSRCWGSWSGCGGGAPLCTGGRGWGPRSRMQGGG